MLHFARDDPFFNFPMSDPNSNLQLPEWILLSHKYSKTDSVSNKFLFKH